MRVRGLLERALESDNEAFSDGKTFRDCVPEERRIEGQRAR